MRTFLRVRRDAPFLTPSAAQDEVLMKGFAFDPQTLKVRAGSKVSWRNADPTEHTVTARDGSFSSRPLASGKGFVVTLSQPGRFDYFCAIHPTMTGTIRVTE